MASPTNPHLRFHRCTYGSYKCCSSKTRWDQTPGNGKYSVNAVEACRRNWTKHIGGSRVSTKVTMSLFKSVWINLFSTRDAVNLTRGIGYHTARKLVSSSPVMLIFTCEVYKTMVDMTGRKIHLMCWKLLVEASYCRKTTAGFLILCKQT